MLRTLILILNLSLLASIASLHALPEVESFEAGVPAHFAAQGGSLSITDAHIQDGKSALRWEFKDGDSFVINTGALGNVNVWTGYGGFLRSSLTVPLYLPNLGEGHILIEVRAGDETAATIAVPFAHDGWQKLVYHYSWQSKMKWVKGNLRDKLDNFRISAHGIKQPSYAIFDQIFYNKPRDFRDVRQAITESWAPLVHDFSHQPAPTSEQLAALDRLSLATTPQPNLKVSPEQWKKQIASLRATIEKEGYHHGKPITKGLGHYFSFLNGIANAWCVCADPALKQEFADLFHTTHDWLQEQGLVVNGALGKADNYVGREYVDAATKMRDALDAHGNLETTIHYLKWAYHYDTQAFGPNYGKSMDYFHNEALRILRIALSHGDPLTRWHHVNTFRDTLGKQLITSIRPDGAIFHHGFHYFAYGSMGMNSVAGTLAMMSTAGLPIAEEGLDAAKNALMMMRWYSGRTTLWSLSGRNAAGTQGVPSGAFFQLARAYAPYRDGKPDPELAAAYLRFEPNAKQPELAGISPEQTPAGFNTMPSAALGMHRRAEWLAGVKGYSKYAASGESYANANRHGLWMSMGQLELLTHPKPLPAVHGSGTRPDEGYNWSAIEGTTTIHTPLKNIANGNGTRIPHSGETFVGGLSNGQNGLFVLTFNNGITEQIMRDRAKEALKPEPLKALKTWFFFDNRILCLGSDISTKNVTFPVRTNLFQKFLTEEFSTTTINGEALTLAETTTARDTKGNTQLIDPYGNAYFTRDGNPVHLEIGKQTSRNNNDSKDTTGNYATAWIEHGTDPQSASYEYSILVQPDKEAIAAYDPAAAYTVVQQDSNAHIVRDHATATAGYVIFAPEAELPADSRLVSAAQPCLVMIAETASQLHIALTKPDIQAEDKTVSLTLRGKLTVAENTSETAVIESTDDLTTITVSVKDGQSVSIRLDQHAPQETEESATTPKS